MKRQWPSHLYSSVPGNVAIGNVVEDGVRPSLQHAQESTLKLAVIDDIGKHWRLILLLTALLLISVVLDVVAACLGELAKMTMVTAHSTTTPRHKDRVVVESSETRVPEFAVAVTLAFLLVDNLDLYHLQIRGCGEAVVGSTQRLVKEVGLSLCQVSSLG